MDVGQKKDLIVRADSRHVVVTGKVLYEPTRIQTIHSDGSKAIDVFANRLPRQFPMQSSTYTARIVELPGYAGSPQTDVVIPGEIRGRVHEHDIVQIVAREDRSLMGGAVRYTAEHISNATTVTLDKNGSLTKSVIEPDAATPVWMARAMPLAAAVLVIALVFWLATGGIALLAGLLAGLALEIIAALMPLLFLCFIVYAFVRMVFRR